MRHPRNEASARPVTALAPVVAGLLALMPAMLLSPAGLSETTAVVLTLVLVALSRRGTHWMVPAARDESGDSTARRSAVPAFSGRVTDPAHHPLRPRAPGLA